jgi:hypothetical protein
MGWVHQTTTIKTKKIRRREQINPKEARAPKQQISTSKIATRVGDQTHPQKSSPDNP